MTDRKHITRAEINALPLWSFEGSIVMLDNLEAIVIAAAKLSAADVIGFDTETRPTFRKGEQYPVALLQLGLEDEVFLLRLCEHGLPEPIRGILEDPGLLKVGIGTEDDVRELKRDFGCDAENVVDLGRLCRGRGYQVSSARKLTALVMGKRISKKQQTSNWACSKLSGAQKAYAATDAWIGQALCRRLFPELISPPAPASPPASG